MAVETPILKPVYEPGPILTAIASKSDKDNFASEKSSEINFNNFSECEKLAVTSSLQTINSPLLCKATEHALVDVSIFKI